MLTQLAPGGFPGQRYGSFAGKTAGANHPVGLLTQLMPGGYPGQRYGSFSGRGPSVIVVDGGPSISQIYSLYLRRRRMAGTNMERAQRLRSCVPLIDTGGAYAEGYLIGTKATLQIPKAVLAQGPGAGTVLEVCIADKDMQKPACTLVLFSSDPSSTDFVNRAPFDIDDLDLPKVSHVKITADDWVQYVDNAECTKSVVLDFVLTDSLTLQLALVARDGVAFTHDDALTITLLILQAL